MKRHAKTMLREANTRKLIQAADAGDAALVAALLPSSAPNGTDDRQLTALAVAAIWGHVACVKILAPASDPNIRDADGMSAALWALAFGDAECLRIMLPRISSGGVIGLDQHGPLGVGALGTKRDFLMLAAVLGHADAARVLLEVCDPFAKDGDGRTALMLAVEQGHEVAAKILLEASDPHARDARGDTALMIAARQRNAKLVRLLAPASDRRRANWGQLANGCQVSGSKSDGAIEDFIQSLDNPTDEGEADLRMASWAGEIEVVENLAPTFARTSRDGKGRTPLMRAAERGHVVCVEPLLAAGDPFAVDETGTSALMWAIRRGELECARLLADVSDAAATDHVGETALMMAAASGMLGIVDVLMARSAVGAVDLLNRTALMRAAASSGWLASLCVESLLRGSDPDAVDLDGMTALMHAAWTGSEASAARLIPHSDCFAVCPFSGYTAADMARQEGHFAIANRIKAHMALVEREAIDMELGPAPEIIRRSRSL